MNKLYLLFLFFVPLCYCQDAYIIDVNDRNIPIKNNSVKLHSQDKVLYYKLLSSDEERSVSFPEIKSVVYSAYKFNVIKINGNSNGDGFFIISETEKIYFATSIYVEFDDNDVATTTYNLNIIDKKTSAVLETLTVSDADDKKNQAQRNAILPFVNQHFSSCFKLLIRFKSFDESNINFKNFSILNALKAPVYFDCNL